ncbi:toprim domain-containing protein [Bacillus changyiensis]|uniref:toprim domain-containing protein n=1 Tax=Bacillus changyiensis TaxID=3004103 RepID=UPI0022E35594|nr:toprim domain-containing protein [Bacillus changyiensis]MDA1476350.1 toprim domain-containing protein [Bacillus changyiensis]
MTESKKVVIVEGKSDKFKIKQLIDEPVDIICTNGTISLTRLDELAEDLYEKDVYILVDADESGEKLRKQLKRELPEAFHIYIDKVYKEVASAPNDHLADILLRANIRVYAKFL